MGEHDDELDTPLVNAMVPTARRPGKAEIADVLADGLEKIAMAIDDGLEEIARALRPTPGD